MKKDRRQPDVSTRPPAVVIYLYHTFYYRSQQYSSRLAIHVHQSLTGCSGTDQRLSGAFDRKLQAAAPCNRHVAVHLQYIVVEGDFHQFFLRTRRLQTQNSVSDNTQIEQPFVSDNSN